MDKGYAKNDSSANSLLELCPNSKKGAANESIWKVITLAKVPPEVSISDLMGILKGKTAICVFHRFPELKTKLYWGNHFWANGYCVDTVGLDSEMIRKYVKYQEQNEPK